MFLQAVHRYLLWASGAAVVLALILSLLFTSRLLDPLARLTEMSRKIAGGDYGARVQTRASGEVGELSSAFNRMADNLARIEQLRKTMVGDVAHELRTPLTNIRGYLEAVTDGVIPPSPALMQSLLEETLRLVKLVDDLAQLARADAARLHLTRVPIVLADCVSHAAGLARAQFDPKSITLDVHVPPTLPRVIADRDSILQALSNLLQNAGQYTPGGGAVTIRTEVSDRPVKTSITNNGDGISPDDLPRIFERFYRGEKSRSRDSGGAGIGLAIVKELIEANEGRVGADSTAGMVTRVVLAARRDALKPQRCEERRTREGTDDDQAISLVGSVGECGRCVARVPQRRRRHGGEADLRGHPYRRGMAEAARSRTFPDLAERRH